MAVGPNNEKWFGIDEGLLCFDKGDWSFYPSETRGRYQTLEVDRQGRVVVDTNLSVKGHRNVFVAGDQACVTHQSGKPLPGIAPVAMQQGRYLARTIRDDLGGKSRQPFQFAEKGQMATIGRSRAIVEIGKFKLTGFPAWIMWLVVHIYFLTGFKNRLLVVLQWAWSYLSFRRGARLIVTKEWRFNPPSPPPYQTPPNLTPPGETPSA